MSKPAYHPPVFTYREDREVGQIRLWCGSEEVTCWFYETPEERQDALRHAKLLAYSTEMYHELSDAHDYFANRADSTDPDETGATGGNTEAHFAENIDNLLRKIESLS